MILSHSPALANRTVPAMMCGLWLAVGLSSGCSRASPFRAIERSVRAELPRLLGPADRYEVTVSRSDGGLIAGRRRRKQDVESVAICLAMLRHRGKANQSAIYKLLQVEAIPIENPAPVRLNNIQFFELCI